MYKEKKFVLLWSYRVGSPTRWAAAPGEVLLGGDPAESHGVAGEQGIKWQKGHIPSPPRQPTNP